MPPRDQEFQTIRSEGGLLPPDLLRRILDPTSRLEGLQPEDYNLSQGERLNEVITQSWNSLRKHWADFQTAAAELAVGEAGTGLTNDKWSLPLLRELGFGLLPTTAGPELAGRTYAISRFFGPVPIHLVGVGLSLDRKAAGQRGAAAVNPHGLVQEFLNRSPGHLWAIISNGCRLRVLRDNQALSRQSFLEFDLEAMFEGEVYSDFVLLWLLVHATRFAPRESDRPDTCWLEAWAKEAEKQGTRALGDLRGGVERALQILGEGFTSHPNNAALRDSLRNGTIPLADFHGQLLRVVYRLIFLFVAEDRELEGQPLLHPRDASDAARASRQRFADHYSTARLRHLAGTIKGSRHGDLWRQFQILVGALSGEPTSAAVRDSLALPALGSFLWSPDSTATINEAELTNFDLLEALRHLAFTRQGRVLRPVDYRNLGAEELGGVYEGLLALTPQISADGARFSFAELAGNERKTSGSYYTPDSLVQCLLDSALDPVVEEALQGKAGAEAEKAILALKVCDPAVGSGHFLVGAAHRLARHLARVRAQAQGESEPSPPMYQSALRDVIGRCLYGVDLSPMAAELCRVSLWLEALEPGKPLSFLDHHIRIGNSLLGATPELIAAGIPDEAFAPIEGDDKKACTILKKRNKAEHSGVGPLFAQQDAETLMLLQQLAAELNELPDNRPEDVRAKDLAFHRREETEEYRRKKQIADAWCAAFVIRKFFSEPGRDRSVSGLTQGHINTLANGRALPEELAAEAELVAAQFQFFHWHLAFPEVHAQGGFDCVLGNPPWDTLSPDQREFFGQWVSGLRSMAADSQRQHIDGLLAEPRIAEQWADHCRRLFGLVHFLKDSGRYTLFAPGNLGKGDFNVYRMFVELALSSARPGGFAGQITPGGLYGGANASAIRKYLLDDCRWDRLYGLSNTRRGWFEEVDMDRFAAYSARRGGRTETLHVKFGLAAPKDLGIPAVAIAADVIREGAPDTYAVPDVRDLAQLATTRKMFAACPAFGDSSSGPPSRHYSREVDMGNNRDLFTEDPEGLPVYEGRMIDHFDHRAKTYVSGRGNSAVWCERAFGDPAKAILPQWRILRSGVPERLGDRCNRFRVGFGDVANPRNERSFASTLIPPGVVCGHTVPTIVFESSHEWAYLPWLAVANSFAMDALVRQKLSSPHMTFTVMDGLPFPRPVLSDASVQYVAPIVLKLVCTSPEMLPFWNQMAQQGLVDVVSGTEPHASALCDEESRAAARAELDAFVAVRIFGLTRLELSVQLDSFDVVRRREEKTAGEFRTKRLIFEALERLG